MSLAGTKSEHSQALPTSRHIRAASFDLFRIGGHDLRACGQELQDAVMATEGIFSVRVDVTNSRLVVTYGDPAALVGVEDTVRQLGFSTDPEQAADVARDWQEFLQNDKLGDD